MRVVIDEREPGTEFAAVTVARARTNGRPRIIEALPPEAPAAPAAASTAPAVVDRRPTRPSAPREDNAPFEVRLARAMQATTRENRERATEELELRRVAILSAIREQRRADALRARQTAAAERRAVDAWAATAQRQIKTERQRRKVELDADLRRTLREQNRQVDRCVKAIEAALTAHREELDAFFDAIERERDPITIAQQARGRPKFPEIATTATTEPCEPSATE